VAIGGNVRTKLQNVQLVRSSGRGRLGGRKFCNWIAAVDKLLFYSPSQHGAEPIFSDTDVGSGVIEITTSARMR
jgi:hypothetical protein